MAKERLEYVDMLKGLSILCIMFLHYEAGCIPQWLNVWIGNFMITAFYFVAGWILAIQKPIATKDLYHKLLHSLGIPYVAFTVIILVFDLIWYSFGYYDSYFLIREIYKTITFRGIGTLWFLPALFGGELIFNYLKNNKRYILPAIIITIILLFAYSKWADTSRNAGTIYQIIDSPLKAINNILRAYPIVALGYLTMPLFPKIKTYGKMKILILSMFVIAASIYFASFCTLNLSIFGIFIAPVLGPFGLLLLCYVISKSRFLSYWGRNSLVMMVTHYSILLVICQKIDSAILHQSEFYGNITILFFIISLLIEYPITWVINQKFPYLLGRKKFHNENTQTNPIG